MRTQAATAAKKSPRKQNAVAPIARVVVPLLQLAPTAGKGCACGGDCPRCKTKPGGSNGLRVSRAGDALEREADAIAAHVMSGTGAAVTSTAANAQVQRAAARADVAASAPSAIAGGLRTPSRPLDRATRTFMEPRFGRDLSHVHIHTGREAAASANSVNARAYTLGNHIVFGGNEYMPASSAGRRLLAHELAHVAQQDAGRGDGVVQRAEVDDRSCATLTDIESDIDTQVSSDIAAARTAAGSPIPAAALPAFLKDVANRLGGFTPVSPIEKFIEALPASKRNLPPNSLAGTKYSGVGSVNRFYMLQTLGAAHVVGSSAKIHGVCVGADKLGHFFEEGFIDWKLSSAGATTSDVKDVNAGLEIGIQGLASTGVFSNADQSANLAGMQFYKDLEANPGGLTFNIKNYITAQWNEQTNPSFYGSSEAGVVWSNLLTGPWEGWFTSGGTSAHIDVRNDLTATATSVTGTYQWPIVKPAQKGKIKNGTIAQTTTSVSGVGITGGSATPVSATPVSGVTIDFEWEEGTSKGKGQWKSVNEQELDGTWGIGASKINGGNWHIKKV
jgi:hypothetical protein